MNINLELYRIFSVVAKHRNITNASKELMISQPAISKSIKNLEDMLGGSLFVRSKRGVMLTEEGKEFLVYVNQALEFINNGENKFSDLINLETGIIRIGISSTLMKEFLLPYLEVFHNRYPKIRIEIHTETSEILFNKMRTGLVDLTVINLPKEAKSDIEIIKCRELEDCFIGSDKFTSFKNKEVSLKEFESVPLVLQGNYSNTRAFLNKFCLNNGVKLKPSIELMSYGLVIEFVKKGFGIGYGIKSFLEEELESGELFEIRLKEKIPKRGIGIAISRNSVPSFSARKLMEIVTKKL